MVKLRAKNLLALALSILMLTGTVTDWLPTALAVAEPSAVTEQAAEPGSTTAELAAEGDDGEGGTQTPTTEDRPARMDFQHPDNGRPNLYVDFLGDNIGNYEEVRNTCSKVLEAPSAYNRDKRTNDISENTWRGYTSDMVSDAGDGNIIFWVGVGVDRTQVWELLKKSGNKGLTSLELGFYYNKTYIEPYTGGDFAETLTNANIKGVYGQRNAWGENYQILHAETDLPVEEDNVLRADLITQDELENPSLDEIRATQHNVDAGADADLWRMTYISLELKDLEDLDRRFKDAYKDYDKDANGNPVAPKAAYGTDADNPPDYLMMIPFVIHKYDANSNADSNYRLCLRLVRDASHFSIGAGNDGIGDEAEGSYAAWERVTTRNEGKNLKLQLRFAGDLNIWNVDTARVADKTYEATLLIQNGGGSQNTARLSVQGDPGSTPVYVDQNNHTISNLQGGTGMEVTVTVQSGYKATIWVYNDGETKDEELGWPFVTVKDEEDSKYYTFVMPNKDTYVRVIFQPDNTRDFTVYLSEIPKPFTEDYMLGNETTVSSFFDHSDPKDLTATPDLQPVSINSFSPRESHPNDGHGNGPRMKVSKGQDLTVTVFTHPDYEARVYLYNFNSQSNMLNPDEVPSDAEYDKYDPSIVILPTGGTVRFEMPQSDVDVVVEYRPANRSKATLEVWHDNGVTPALMKQVEGVNIAQLAYLSYDNQAAVSTAYSGQVYDDVDPDNTGDDSAHNHSAVKKPSGKTPWVPYSAAAISKSLGGDTGRTGRAWSSGASSLMAHMVSATSESNLAARFNALDLMGADLLGDGTYMGLRKNLDGEPYGDGELGKAAELLWELRSKILADTSTNGLKENYYAEETQSDGTTYNYFALTPAQVQAYLIDWLKIEGIFRANQQAYREVYQIYQEVKPIYDVLADSSLATTGRVPDLIAPTEPLNTVEDGDIGLREYQDEKYLTDYIGEKDVSAPVAADGETTYREYITKYQEYITALADGESPPDFGLHPTESPERVEVKLRESDDAKNVVNSAINRWDDTSTVGQTAEVETAAAVSTRSGRTVWLLLEADSAYEVESVQLLDAEDRNPLTTVGGAFMEPRASTSFKNVYTFTMPEKDCVILVTYKLRGQKVLKWQVIGANDLPNNVAHIEAYQVTTKNTLANHDSKWTDNVYPDDITKPTLAKRTNEGNTDKNPYPATLDEEDYWVGRFEYDENGENPVAVEGVLVDSTVTVRTICAEKYTVRVKAYAGVGGNEIPVTSTSNGEVGIHTFPVKEGSNRDVLLTIEYIPDGRNPHTARIRMLNYEGASDNDYSGLWYEVDAIDINRESDTPITGHIDLKPGYYIYTSYSVGSKGSYPYTLDGNGYNDGLGAGSLSDDGRAPVTLKTIMPEDELWIYIVVRKGIPPDEPANALTVVVVDEENKANPLADNWAKATVYPRPPRENDDPARSKIVLDTVSVQTVYSSEEGEENVHRVTYDGKNGEPIMAGDRVELDLSADEGFYIAEVALQPSYLGGDLEWLPVEDPVFNSGGRKLQFTMPAGSTTVTVRFRKLDDTTKLLPSHYIHVMKTETDRNGAPVTTTYVDKARNNHITSANSSTIQSFTGGNSYSIGFATPEQVPSSDKGRGAGVAGETVTMTFEVAKGWYVQSVAVMTDGSARPVDYELIPGTGNNDGNGGAFTADIVMPSGDAWFIVKYRECPVNLPRPEIPEYAITLMVIDDDNVTDPRAENTVTASFIGDEGFAHSTISANCYSSTAIQYIHAGDRVMLNHDLASGYSLDYMIVNPTELGLVPTYLDAKNAQFTMPARNITVIAKIVKRAQQQYTADLILRPPAGVDIDLVGQGTFTNTIMVKGNDGTETPFTPSLDNYAANAIYSLLLNPGEPVNFDLFAFDGYYIREVTVEPAVGVTSSLTGSFGRQSGGFVMPAANVYVNVYFEKLWPDQVQYDLTLKVHDASAKENNYAHFATVGGVAFPADDQKHVHGGETHTVRRAALDGQEIYVTLNREAGHYYDPASIQVTDSSGAEIPWRMTAWRETPTGPVSTGIAFLMPPRSTTVEITFRKDNRTEEENPARKAWLHVKMEDGTSVTWGKEEILRLYRNSGLTSGDVAGADETFISDLYAGDMLHLQIENLRTEYRVASVYAIDGATGDQLIRPITQVPNGGLSSFPVPTLSAEYLASLADGEKIPDIHVYVILQEKTTENHLNDIMNLVVNGPVNSGSATLFETANETTKTVTAYAGVAGPLPPDELRSPTGFIHALAGSALTVNIDPEDGYYLSELTVTDNYGNKVSYDWISLVVDEEKTDPAAWYPVWKQNPKQQITLLMPAGGGTVQVTYAKIPTDPEHPKGILYTAQVVVNNDAYTGTDPDRNNAWLSVAKNAEGKRILDKLVTAKAGDWVELDITVQAGYRILPIFVSPQSFGIQPYLHLGDLDSQTTGFVMPAGDVTVYVQFVADGLTPFNAYLIVEGYRGTEDPNVVGPNQAFIESDRTGRRGPIDATVGQNSTSVQAYPVREWVTVEYNWAEDSWVSSLTVKDRSNRDIPFTQVDKHTITLPMVARDVYITVTYTKGEPPTPDDPPKNPTPALTPVRLHVIDMTNDHSITNDETKGWGRVTHNGTDADVTETDVTSTGNGHDITFEHDGSTKRLERTKKLAADYIKDGQPDAEWDNWEMIWVPAGRTVTLEAYSNVDQGIYIHSAYVLYRDGGQMINCNLRPNSRDNGAAEGTVGFFDYRTATFEAHPDYNDVYVFLTKEKPKANEFAATLMLKSPEEDSDTGSVAAIWTWDETKKDFKDKATVKANGNHGRITAERNETVTVTVTPMEGYAVDYILMTPLGIPIVPQRTGTGTYTFTMPGYNVNACVYLKRSNEREFKVTLHYEERRKNADDPIGEHNSATVSWNPDETTKDSRTVSNDLLVSEPMIVKENSTVTLDITLDDPYVVLAAYVLQDGAIVPLDPGPLEGTVENVSQIDNSLSDGTATFTMPGGNVDVFVVTTNDPPEGEWYVAVLTVKDPDNSGDCISYIERDDTTIDSASVLPNPPFEQYTEVRSKVPTANHDFIVVREGQDVIVTVWEDTTGKYAFDPPPQLTHAGTYTGTLVSEISSATRYRYKYITGPCDSAVLVNFKKKDAETVSLTVEIEDPDNPGNDTVTNAVTTTVTDLDPLELESTSALGSYQIMPGVAVGDTVNFVVDPAEGYTAMAVLTTVNGTTGTETTYLTLTPTTDGSDHLTGSFIMPGSDSTLTVTFFRPYTGELVLRDLSSARGHTAQMTESTLTPPDTVTVDTVNFSNKLHDLPNGTTLTAQMVDFDKTKNEKVTALLTRDGSTTILPSSGVNAEGADEYTHTISRTELTTITLVVTDRDPANPDNDPYIAAVRTVNKPSGTADPTIQASTAPAAGGSGVIWTTAQKEDLITVTLDVPAGYEAVLKIDNGLTLTPPGPFSGPVTNQTTTFTMPAANVQVTIEYRRVDFDLTLRVVDTSGVTNTTIVTPEGLADLTADGDHAVVAAGTDVAVSATPAAGAVIRSITVSSTGRANNYLVSSPKDPGEDYTGSFPMPDADTVITVVYAKATPSSEDPDPYYLAFSAVAYEDDTDPVDPGNRVVSIQNITRSTLMGGGNLPVNSPYWTAGYAKDSVTVSYETAPGYYATASAKRNSDNKAIPVVLLDHGTGGTATASFPNTPSSDITITITYHYSTVEPPKETKDVALQLVGHRGERDNKAQTTGVALVGLALDGSYATNIYDPVEEIKSAATVGDDLRTLANWANGYQVIRMTVAVRHTDSDGTVTETGEVDLLRSTYGGTVTSRTTMPTVGENEIAVIRVYYGSNYSATLHIEPHSVDNQNVNGNQTSATDGGGATIDHHLDRLENLAGGETITTTAIPGPGQRLVGVVYESATKGATAAKPNKPDDNDPRYSKDKKYNFPMPAEDVDFYAVYQPEPDDPKDKQYIAKVRFDDGDEHLGDSRNAVTITNSTDATAAKGKYWTAAKEGNAVVVNVKVAPGYKAEIITAKVDDQTKVPVGREWEDSFHYYINRVSFVPNLTLGKDATFTMPAETDATVTIRFTKSYKLSLEVSDVSNVVTPGNLNQADVTTTPNVGSLHGESDGTTVTNPAAPLTGVPGGTTTITTAVIKAADAAKYRVLYKTDFGGTVRVDNPFVPAADDRYDYPMPSADVEETVLFYNNETPLLAKVEVKGESDINGNSVQSIIDKTDTDDGTGKTTTGTIWTTTAGGNTIQMQLTVAKGYVAKIQVRRDNTVYYADPDNAEYLGVREFKFEKGFYKLDTETDPTNPTDVYEQTRFLPDPAPGDPTPAESYEVEMGYQERIPHDPFPENIGGEEFFIFEMPTTDTNGISDPTDVTVIVEFVFAGTMPRPFDPGPDNMEMEKIDLERGFIYGENRGDFALIDIPTLYQDSNQKLFNTHNYDKENADPQRKVKFNFFLYNADKDEYTPLVLGTDVLLEPVDPETANVDPPYNYYPYKTKRANNDDTLDDNETGNGEKEYTGSRFKLIPTEADELTGERTDGAQALYDMLNNKSTLARQEDGSLATNGEGKYYTTLYVMAEDMVGQKSAYTQVWIRPHFTLEVQVISYAPTHTTTANLYKLMSQEELDEVSGYAADNTLPQVTQDKQKIEHYRWNEDDKPYLSNYTAYEGPVVGASKYYQKIGVQSSELLGKYTPSYDPGADNLLTNVVKAAADNGDFTYALTLEKTSCLTYTRVALNLWEGEDLSASSDPIPTGYDKDTLTYTISDLIYLITGDVDGDKHTKWQDYDTVYSYVWRNIPWNNTQTEPLEPTDPNYIKWLLSTYNPDSMAYRCDLDGDRSLSVQDLNLVQTVFDYNRTEEDYMWTKFQMVDGKREYGKKVLPFGLGMRDSGGYASLFAVREEEDVFPVEPDDYWDSLVDPKTTKAPALNNIVDEDGNLWSFYLWLEDEPGYEDAISTSPSRDTGGGRRDDAVIAIPGGDEVVEHPGAIPERPVFDPGVVVELPTFDPELDMDLPDPDPDPTPDLPQNNHNGPGGDPAETPADITTEE